jgi:hypothetical protein
VPASHQAGCQQATDSCSDDRDSHLLFSQLVRRPEIGRWLVDYGHASADSWGERSPVNAAGSLPTEIRVKRLLSLQPTPGHRCLHVIYRRFRSALLLPRNLTYLRILRPNFTVNSESALAVAQR